MAVREILLLGNPVLRKKCEKIKTISEDIHKIVQDLKDTLDNFRTTHGFGRGISAPQIGVPKKVIFLQVNEPIVIINPEIIRRSRQKMTLWDDCFSFPDIVVKVKRYTKITVRYTDVQGKRQAIHAAGDLSELLQHEIDHLDGILAIDRAIDSKHIIFKSEMKNLVHLKGDTLLL